MRTLFVVIVILALASPALSSEIDERVLTPSVKLLASGEDSYGRSASGTGVVVVCPDGAAYVLTAGHVVAGLRREVEYLDETSGQTRKRVEWADAQIVQTLIEEDRKVGELRLDCQMVAYSPSEEDGGEDLALLRVRKSGFLRTGARLLPAGQRVQVAQPVYHVGALLGERPALTSGIVAAVGVLFRGRAFHQTDTMAAPGSSGGGVFVQHEGKFCYAGMITRGSGDRSVVLFIPLDRIRAFLKQAGHEKIAEGR